MGTGENRTLMRQWAMLCHIPRLPARISVAELDELLALEGHQVARRTIERDLHSLSSQFSLTVDERSKPFGWSWAKGAGLHVLPQLTSAQSVALLLAKQHLRDLLPTSLHRELGPLFSAAQRSLTATGWSDWHQRTAVIPTGLSLIPPRIPQSVMERIQVAIAGGRCLEADYRSKGQNRSRRLRIHPFGLLARGAVIYLVGTIFDYEDVRQLALHRFGNVTVLDHARREIPGFNVAEYAAAEGRPIGSQGPVELVVRFDTAAAEHLSETLLSADQTLESVEGGKRVELRATVEDDDRLYWWLLGFGPQVEVIAPQSLRAAQMRAHLESVDRYEAADPS